MKEWKGSRRVHCWDSMEHSFNNEEYKGEVNVLDFLSGCNFYEFWLWSGPLYLGIDLQWAITGYVSVSHSKEICHLGNSEHVVSVLFSVNFKRCWIMVKSRNLFCWAVKQQFFWKLLVILIHLIKGRKGRGLELIWGISVSLCKFPKIQWNY